MIAIFVSIRVKEGFMSKFIEHTLDDAKGSVSDEPGCYRFDVLKDDSDPNLVHLYEVYVSPEALEAHRKMPHYSKWAKVTKNWRAEGSSQRIEATTVFPSDNGWRNQKSLLMS